MSFIHVTEGLCDCGRPIAPPRSRIVSPPRALFTSSEKGALVCSCPRSIRFDHEVSRGIRPHRQRRGKPIKPVVTFVDLSTPAGGCSRQARRPNANDKSRATHQRSLARSPRQGSAADPANNVVVGTSERRRSLVVADGGLRATAHPTAHNWDLGGEKAKRALAPADKAIIRQLAGTF